MEKNNEAKENLTKTIDYLLESRNKTWSDYGRYTNMSRQRISKKKTNNSWKYIDLVLLGTFLGYHLEIVDDETDVRIRL